MNIIRNPEKSTWSGLLKRPRLDHSILEDQVQKIINEVALNGDAAVSAYTREFDHYDSDSIEVTDEEIRAAKADVSKDLRKAIEEAHWNIQTFHRKQMQTYDTIVTTAGVGSIGRWSDYRLRYWSG